MSRVEVEAWKSIADFRSRDCSCETTILGKCRCWRVTLTIEENYIDLEWSEAYDLFVDLGKLFAQEDEPTHV